MVKCYRKGVSLSDFWVSSNERLSDFYASSWQRGESPLPMLIVRALLLALSAGILAWSVVNSPTSYWLVYLTNWGLVLVTATMLTGTVTSVMALCKNPADSDSAPLPWYASLYWFFFNVSSTLALMITALYWILLYDPDPDSDDNEAGLFLLDVFTHGVNSCIVFVEVVTSRTPVRALHVYQPLGVGLWYAAFSGIYYAAGGTDGNGNPYIYDVLDWRQGRRAGAIVAGSAAGVLIIYSVLWGTVLCRDKISGALVRTVSHTLAATPPDRHSDNTMLV